MSSLDISSLDLTSSDLQLDLSDFGAGYQDVSNLELVYSENKHILFAIARNLLRNNTDAEDAVQNAFMRLVNKQNLPTENLKKYVYASVRNASYDILRKRTRLNESPYDFFDDFNNSDNETPFHLMKKDEKARRMKQIINGLKEKQREVVIMKAYGGLTFEEIADILDEPLSTISSRYIRTLEKLKDEVVDL